MKLKHLKKKWNEEKQSYKDREIGSGVHSFIRSFLESYDLLSLKEGSLSKKQRKRKNEYIYEEKSKEQRRADFVIYISSEIIIPLEAKCYGNIEAGVKQLFRYQKDFDKKYGILTDGFTWRFYNNNIPKKEFNLDQIFKNPNLFLDFWKEYIKPEFYYLSFFEPKGQVSLLKGEGALLVEKNRQMFFEDITKLIENFNNKLKIEGYLESLNEKFSEKTAIELTYAYIIQFILYKTLVDNKFGKLDKEFKKRVKTIHKYLKEKRYKETLGIIDGVSAQISENIYKPFKKEQEFIRKKLLKIYHGVENNLSDVSPWLEIFLFIKKYNFANIKNEIFGYIYENYLKELYEDKNKGQYFTDPNMVNFMLKQIGFTSKKIKEKYEKDKNSISLIDPACGSGTFLYSAVSKIIKSFKNHTEEKSKRIEEVVNKNVFGLDIAELPLYLAEMNILMRMLPLIINKKYNNPVDKKIKVFLTEDSVSEFKDTSIWSKDKERQYSLEYKSKGLGYKSYVRDEKDLNEMKNSLKNYPKISRLRFDYVIGNPPYISYNNCCRQKVKIFQLMKNNEAKLSNIYGANLHSTPENSKKYRPNPNLYAFFLALGIALLKDNGKLCYIVPQTMLTAGDLDVIRYYLSKFSTLEKIIIFPHKMFTGRGLKQRKQVATSSIVLVIKKKKPKESHKVKIIYYKGKNNNIKKTLEDITKKRNIYKNEILQNRLLDNVLSWNFIKQDKKQLDFYNSYKDVGKNISIYYNHSLSMPKFKNKFFFDSGYSIDESKLPEVKKDKYYCYPKTDSNFWTIKKCKGYWPNIRSGSSPFTIKLRQANQGYNLLNSKYKVIWSYHNPKKFYFTEKPIIWARNQFCAIGSKSKNEVLYLFSILNSPLTSFVLKSNLRSKQEKNFLVSTTAIKNFVRVPKISSNNKYIKREIIKYAEKIIDLDKKRLSDFVDFSGVMVQKFDNFKITNKNLVLTYNKKKLKLPIIKNQKLVKSFLKEKYKKLLKLELEGKKIMLSELKDLFIINYQKQKEKRNYINDLIFALYFNIKFKKIGLAHIKEIRKKCSKNPFYDLLNNLEL
jgi:hypothetical protein